MKPRTWAEASGRGVGTPTGQGCSALHSTQTDDPSLFPQVRELRLYEALHLPCQVHLASQLCFLTGLSCSSRLNERTVYERPVA